VSNESLLWLLLLQLFFIFLNAVFSCAEIAVITMNDNKLAQLTAAGDKRAVRLSKLTAQPARFLATIQIGITLVTLLSSAVAAENFSDRLANGLSNLGWTISGSVLNIISVALITVILTYFTVLLGELIPKRIAMKNAERFALGMSGFVSVLSRIFAPLVWLFTVSTNGLLRLFGVNPNNEENENAEEEIRMILDAGKEKGTIPPDEQRFIQNVFEFDDIPIEEIMTHRTNVSFLWMNETDEQWESAIIKNKHSVFPICQGSPDNVVGILSAKNYLRLADKTRENVLSHAVQPAVFVPETVRADVLFRSMKNNRNHFAVVVDDYGGMSGIITMNDLLEQLVGDLDDDARLTKGLPFIEQIDAKTWRILGSAPLQEVAKQLGVILPKKDYNTFGGLVFDLLGTVPPDGSTPEVEGFGMKIKVTQIKRRRLTSAVVSLTDGTVPDAETASK
jgi:putative hemolysin